MSAAKADFKPIYYNPMSMGTRCHQAAQYIVLDSPLTMLCDSPTNYEKDNTFTNFISIIPNVYDDTKVIDGKLGEYIITARKKGDNWYIGGLTNWNERNVSIPLSFLDEGHYCMILVRDGVNANNNAQDYSIDTINISKIESLNVKMASGGGFAIALLPLAY